MNFQITQMTKDDLEVIKNILTIEFDDFWNYTTLRGELENPNSSYFVCKFNHAIVGFAGLWRAVDDIHITNIVVKKDLRKMGIGSLLLEKLIEIAKEEQAQSITLEVNSKNATAYQLYLKYHFKIVGLRKKYYHSTDDAIIMTLNLQ